MKSIQNIYYIDLLRMTFTQAVRMSLFSNTSENEHYKKLLLFKMNLENKEYIFPDLFLKRGGGEGVLGRCRRINGPDTNKMRITSHNNIAGRPLKKVSPLKRIQFPNLRITKSEATSLNSFPRKYCRGLNNRKTYWKETSATGSAIDQEKHV